MNKEMILDISTQTQPDYIFYGGERYKKIKSKAKKCPECGRRKTLWIVCPKCGYEYEEPQFETCAWCGKKFRKLRKRQKYCSQQCHHERDKDAARKRLSQQGGNNG